MKHTLSTTLILVALLLNSGAAAALGQSSSTSLVPALTVIQPLTVRIAVPVEDGVTNPVDPAFRGIPLLTDQLFSGLTRIDPATDLPVPDLAASWTSNLARTQFTFMLRSGLKWSNGTALTAADVRYGILRSLKPSTGSPYAYELYSILNAEAYNTGGITNANLVGVTVLSPTQIKFTLTGPASYFPAILARSVARPVPAPAITKWGSTWTEPGHIVTSGPYRLKEWVHFDHFLLDRYTGFYAAAGVKILHISAVELDTATAWTRFLAGELDTTEVPLTELAAVKADPTLSPLLHASQPGCTTLYGFSTSQAPFDEPLVRMAFAAAINRQGLIDTVLGGGPQPALTFTPPGIFGHVDGVANAIGIPYDVTQAQSYLSDAGHPGGADLPSITLSFNTNPTNQSIAEYIRQNWIDNLGVTVSLQSVASGYGALVDSGTLQIWRQGWCLDYNDAYNFLSDFVISFQPGKFGGWLNTSYTNALSQAVQTTDNPDRLGHYKDAEEILVETDAVLVPIYYHSLPVLTRAYLQRPYSLDTHIRDWELVTTTSTLESEGSKDGWILESSEISNQGGTLNATGTTFFLGDNAKDRQYRSVLSFDTSGLPDGAVITSVTLKIKSAGLVGTNPFTTHGNLLADASLGAFSGDDSLQVQDFQAPASKNAAITIKNKPVSGWYSGVMGAANFAYINRTGVTQFRLRFAKDDNDDLGADYLKFYSGDFLTATSHPQLIIKYYAP